MPIYAYKCESCGHQQDVLQKMSDPLLTVCPACGKDHFVKQLTAAGFQLKGSGWYATDFRQSGSAAPAKDAQAAKEGAAGKSDSKPEASSTTPAASGAAAAPAKPASAAPAAGPAAAPPPASA